MEPLPPLPIIPRPRRAGIGTRVVAGLFDHLILASGVALIHASGAARGLAPAYEMGGLVALYVAAFTAQEVLFGRTLGKAALGLEIRDGAGRMAPVSARLVRNLARLPWAFPLFLLPDLLLLAFDREGRRVGDLLADTRVVTDGAKQAGEVFSGSGS